MSPSLFTYTTNIRSENPYTVFPTALVHYGYSASLKVQHDRPPNMLIKCPR